MNDKDLLDLLLTERNRHNEHPQTVNTRVAFLVAAFITSSVIVSDELRFNVFVGCLIGFGVAIYGLVLHTKKHFLQRDLLDESIDKLIAGETTEFVLQQHREINKSSNNCPILPCEPDKSSFWNYHDTYIYGGILIMLVSALVGIYFTDGLMY